MEVIIIFLERRETLRTIKLMKYSLKQYGTIIIKDDRNIPVLIGHLL